MHVSFSNYIVYHKDAGVILQLKFNWISIQACESTFRISMNNEHIHMIAISLIKGFKNITKHFYSFTYVYH